MTPPNPTAQKTFLPPPSGVTVRMYNPGFGDCLLLAFKGNDGQARYMLIDCGVHHQYPDGQQRMQTVAEDIAAATNHRLHVVVATHEHTDHLSGFDYAREVFDHIEIEDVWMAWTEDPTDDIALGLKNRAKKATEALNAVVNRLDSHNEPLGAALRGVLDFEYTKKESGPLDYLRRKGRKQLKRSEDFRRPGEVLTLPDVGGVKIYVLGPPRNKPEYISIVDVESQLYPELRALKEWDDFAFAALAAAAGESSDDELSRPFDLTLAITSDKARQHQDFGDFFRTYYGFSDAPKDGPEWRRIECDWLGTAEQLALKLNDWTNNTSLVLAIELTETQPRKVLLFAADAQAGNWLSWRDLSWPGAGESGKELKVEHLLQRTMFYKVGHHGSRNATLSELGLELMVSPDLVAMIPVNEVWAFERKPPWKHPAKTLLERLTAKTRGRVLRSDKIPQEDRPPDKPDRATPEEWHEFIHGLDWDRSPERLWVQFTITG
jgi:beta-lactamase superfamily II metal-dependent hydrolase